MPVTGDSQKTPPQGVVVECVFVRGIHDVDFFAAISAGVHLWASGLNSLFELCVVQKSYLIGRESVGLLPMWMRHSRRVWLREKERKEMFVKYAKKLREPETYDMILQRAELQHGIKRLWQMSLPQPRKTKYHLLPQGLALETSDTSPVRLKSTWNGEMTPNPQFIYWCIVGSLPELGSPSATTHIFWILNDKLSSLLWLYREWKMREGNLRGLLWKIVERLRYLLSQF